MEITYTIESTGVRGTEVRAAYARASEIMDRNIDEKLSQGAEEVAIEAKREAPAVHGVIASSIAAEKTGHFAYVVDTPINYAPYVEQGTGPAIGKPAYFPPPEKLLDYLRVSPSYRGFSWAGTKTKKRLQQEAELMYRAKAFAVHIYRYGTQPHPFMRTARDNKESRLAQLVREGVDNGIREAFA